MTDYRIVSIILQFNVDLLWYNLISFHCSFVRDNLKHIQVHRWRCLVTNVLSAVHQWSAVWASTCGRRSCVWPDWPLPSCCRGHWCRCWVSDGTGPTETNVQATISSFTHFTWASLKGVCVCLCFCLKEQFLQKLHFSSFTPGFPNFFVKIKLIYH